MKHLITLILFFSLLILTGNSFSQTDSTKSAKSILIMPFDYYQKFPYSHDLIRESLVTGFLTKNFSVTVDEKIWEKVLEKEWNLTNLSYDEIEELAEEIDVDFILFGNNNNYSAMRNLGMYETKTIGKPILIKIYDTKKKETVLFERLSFNTHWGLWQQNLSINDFGAEIATKLKNMGY